MTTGTLSPQGCSIISFFEESAPDDRLARACEEGKRERKGGHSFEEMMTVVRARPTILWGMRTYYIYIMADIRDAIAREKAIKGWNG
jgi:hypothetical protein